jgi:YD repeat-containing protein
LISLVLRIMGILVLLATCAAVGLCVYSNMSLTRSDAYKDSLKTAFSSPEVQNILGSGIHAKFPALGHVVSFGPSEFSEWSVALAGSHGSGHLYGVANQINGAWEFSRLVFKSQDGKSRIELTPVHKISLPQVPTKNVYLIPLGLDGAESLAWAPPYYKAKLGIDVTVLPAVPLDSDLIDRKRNQLDGDRCIDEFLQRKYPELARDPFAIVVAVTSHDIYAPSLGWTYAENLRHEGRFAVVSSARLHPPAPLEKVNPEWLNARLQKLLTKNLAILYFDLPMSSDYTSLVSGGILSGSEVDQMGGTLVGSEGRWDPFTGSRGPAVTIYEVPGKSPLWKKQSVGSALPDTSAQVFSASLNVGLVVQYKTDFLFEDEPGLRFTRVYRNQDDRSRAFGIGGSDSFDMFLGGKMGVAVDLIMDDGVRINFFHQPPQVGQRGDTYRPRPGTGGRFVEAVFLGNTWQVTTNDGWSYFFPYRPEALPQYVTVLTSFVDPALRKYEMQRDSFGALLEVTGTSGKWLRMENDFQHRIRKITSSSGRTMQYVYDADGHMIRATDSEEQVESYTYDEKGQMLTAAHGNEKPFLTNEYFVDGYIKSQTMGNGQSFTYAYFRDDGMIRENAITDPNGLETYVQYGPDGYLEFLPGRPGDRP